MASLRRLLALNAASCLLFGALFAALPGLTAGFLGQPPATLIRLIGIGLILNGAHLLWASRRSPARAEVLWFSAGDLAWWLASVLLVAFPVWITTPPGQIVTLTVASGVAFLGLAQLWCLALDDLGITARAFRARLLAAWFGLKLWVRVWLVILNLVFLAALFLPAYARPVLLSYVASGPLLLGLFFLQRGFTRATGLGHLLAWGPLVVWLAQWSPATAADVAYGLILAAALAVCLVFDALDLIRWLRGERECLGGVDPVAGGQGYSG